MPKFDNDQIVQKFLAPPIQQNINGSSSLTKKSVATARLAFSKQAASQRVNQNKQALQLKQSLGFPNNPPVNNGNGNSPVIEQSQVSPVIEDKPSFPWRSDVKAPTQHLIKKGDNLSKISQNTGVSIDDLVQFNNISDPNQIKEGQKLNLSSPDAYNAEIDKNIEAAATKHDLPLEYVRTLFTKESNLDQSAISPKTKFGGNVRGIAQMTEKTMQEQIPGGDTKNVWDQIEGGVKYTKYLYDRWIDKGFEPKQAIQLTSAAYNGGFSRIAEAITATGEKNPSMQTIAKIGRKHFKNKKNAKKTKDGSNKDVFQFDQALNHVKKIHFNTAGELTDFTSGRLPADTISETAIKAGSKKRKKQYGGYAGESSEIPEQVVQPEIPSSDTVEDLPSVSLPTALTEEDMIKPFTELGTPVEELEQPPVTTEEEPGLTTQEKIDLFKDLPGEDTVPQYSEKVQRLLDKDPDEIPEQSAQIEQEVETEMPDDSLVTEDPGMVGEFGHEDTYATTAPLEKLTDPVTPIEPEVDTDTRDMLLAREKAETQQKIERQRREYEKSLKLADSGVSQESAIPEESTDSIKQDPDILGTDEFGDRHPSATIASDPGDQLDDTSLTMKEQDELALKTETDRTLAIKKQEYKDAGYPSDLHLFTEKEQRLFIAGAKASEKLGNVEWSKKWEKAKKALYRGVGKGVDRLGEGKDKAIDTIVDLAKELYYGPEKVPDTTTGEIVKVDPEVDPIQAIYERELKKHEAVYGKQGTSFRDRILAADVNGAWRAKVLDMVKEPSLISDSPIVNIDGDVIEHADGTFSVDFDGKTVSNFPTKKAAKFHAVSYHANKRILAGGGYEQWSLGDLTKTLMGSLAQVGETGARFVFVGDPTLNGKVREYNTLKQAQHLLNDPKTDISDQDLKDYRAIRNNKVLTPALEAFKNDPKFTAIAKLDKEAKANVEMSKRIEEYGAAWRKLFPENDSGWQGSQAAYDLIAANEGTWEAVFDAFKNHKAANAKKGISNAAYSLVLMTGGLYKGTAVLSTFALDEIRKAKIEWVEKNGEENFSSDIETQIELAFAFKVMTEKFSLGYFRDSVGAFTNPAKRAWMAKSGQYINRVVPNTVRKLSGLAGSTLGEGSQGAFEEVIRAIGMGEEIKPSEVGKGFVGESLGTVTLGPITAAKQLTEQGIKKVIEPSAKEQRKSALENKIKTLENKIKKIEEVEKATDPKDAANLEALTNEVVELEQALAELPNASIDRWGQDSEPKLTSGNALIKKLFKDYAPLLNDTTFTAQDLLNELKQQLEDQLNTKGAELDAFEKRMPKPTKEEPSLKDRVSRKGVSNIFSDETEDTSIKVGDTRYGELQEERLQQLEDDVEKIENDTELSEVEKVIALDRVTEEHNNIAAKLEQPASPSLLKAEKQYLQTQLEKTETQIKGKGESIQDIYNIQINKDAGTDISDEEVVIVLEKIIKMSDPDRAEYVPLEEEVDYGKGDIVDLKNNENEEASTLQGYVIKEVLGKQADGNIHVRLEGVNETIPIDQLIPRVRPDETPRTILEQF